MKIQFFEPSCCTVIRSTWICRRWPRLWSGSYGQVVKSPRARAPSEDEPQEDHDGGRHHTRNRPRPTRGWALGRGRGDTGATGRGGDLSGGCKGAAEGVRWRFPPRATQTAPPPSLNGQTCLKRPPTLPSYSGTLATARNLGSLAAQLSGCIAELSRSRREVVQVLRYDRSRFFEMSPKSTLRNEPRLWSF